MEIVDVDAEADYPPISVNPSAGGAVQYPNVPMAYQNLYELPPIDIPYEASKLPLDVAIFNSARSAGGLDRIRKYLQAVLVVGGTALVPGMSHALESRLQAIAMPLVPNMEKVTIIAAQKDVDARNLAWKGAAVLAKMDGVNDLWISGDDWVSTLPASCFIQICFLRCHSANTGYAWSQRAMFLFVILRSYGWLCNESWVCVRCLLRYTTMLFHEKDTMHQTLSRSFISIRSSG